MNVPYQLANNSALTRSSLTDAIKALDRIVYANIEQMNVSSHNVPEVAFINQQIETTIGFKDDPDNVTMMKELSESMIEQGNISCYEIRYFCYIMVYI